MGLNLAHLSWGLARLRAGKTADLRDMAVREWEISPAETTTVPPAIHLDGAMDRIQAVTPWSDAATERQMVEGGPIDHAASRAHLVENVTLAAPMLYSGPAKFRAGYGMPGLTMEAPGPVERIAEAHLVSNWTGADFFGPFTLDCLPLELLPPEGARPLAVATKPYEHLAGYRALLGLPAPAESVRARIGALTLYTDFAQNASKEVRYRQLRSRLRTRLAEAQSVTGPGVYLKRGITGERRIIANEPEIEALLAGLGFDIIEPARLDAGEIARRTLEARIVIGVEGSHLSHAVFSAHDDACFLVLQPPDRFATYYKEFTDRVGMRYAFVVGDPTEDGFRIVPDELTALLDRVSSL